MPSHITHVLFGRDSLLRIPSAPSCSTWFDLGCQGPDMFLHNQRRKPSSVLWGRSLHRENYGVFAGGMESVLASKGLNWDSPEGQYVLGFAAHALLDRITHPYIYAWSASKGTSWRGAHPFLERIIDVEMCVLKTGCHPFAYPFFRKVHLGEHPPHSLVSLLSESVKLHFPSKYTAHAELLIENAYKDTMGLFALTDLWNESAIEKELQKRSPERRKRLLTLFHPPEVPEGLDVLNRDHRTWCDPWETELLRKESFLELYEKAVQECSALFAKIISCEPSDEGRIKALIGNENLNGSRGKEHAGAVRCDGLPLEEVFTQMYSLFF